MKGASGAEAGTNAPGMSNGKTSNENGASTGMQGTDASQDATGVKGAQDSTNGPSMKKPSDSSK
jgi:hypothetical protein